MDHQQHDIRNEKDCKEDIFLSLPKGGGEGWGFGEHYEYQGAWWTRSLLESVMATQRDFQALETDIMLATLPRCGTIWLKSLAFAIVNRTRYPPITTSLSTNNNNVKHPLLTTSPHDLVPFLEFKHYFDKNPCFPDQLPEVDNKSSYPRLIASHVPYICLPESVKNTNCKIVYLCREPKDQFVSLWHFNNKWKPTVSEGKDVDPLPVEEAFDLYCSGVWSSGPFWDHQLGYWKESLEKPKKVLFLKYEEMTNHPISHVKKLAEFLGYPFSKEEESAGVLEELISLCSFEALKSLDVKTSVNLDVENKIFFRKGKVGDWKNYLTPIMAERLDRLRDDKLRGSGLVFEKDCASHLA